jgi:DnaJ-class molecular chaperone
MFERGLVIAVIGWSLFAPAHRDLRPDVAVYGRYALMGAPTRPVQPVSTDCGNCRGTGFVGDTVVSSKCPVCKGTGKVVSPSAAAGSSRQSTPCVTGTCPPNATRR